MSWGSAIGIVRARGSLRSLARWLFLGTLVAAPWLYGGTTAVTIEVIEILLGVTLAFWVASFFVDRRRPNVPRTLAIVAGLILVQGWWMVANSHALYDSTFRTFVGLPSYLAGAPGSVDSARSFAWMLRATLLLGAVGLVADMVQRPSWLVRLWFAIAVAGGSIALLGLLQKATGAKMIFWAPPVWPPMLDFFATYFYHANAGAFLNLVFAPIAGLLFWTIRRGASTALRTLWLTLLFFVGLAILSNTSRMAQAVAGAICVVLVIAVMRPARRMIAETERRTVILASVLVAITVVAIAQAVRLDRPLQRWSELSEQLPASVRWTAYWVALEGTGDAGFFGFGPATFQSVFPHYQQTFGNQPPGTWRFLHDDYLQTILEWGWVGSALIAALFLGGIGVGLRNYLRAEGWSTRQRILLSCVLLALVGTAFHAIVDFPLQILSLQLFVATYLGVCWGSGKWDRKVEARTRMPEAEIARRPDR